MHCFTLPDKSCHVSSVVLQPPQFVDIPLEEDDSSDEEYQPDDEDEDETAEEVNVTCAEICPARCCLHREAAEHSDLPSECL